MPRRARLDAAANIAQRHTVEKLQSFTKARSLSLPWENVVRIAASQLIQSIPRSGGHETRCWRHKVVASSQRPSPGVRVFPLIPAFAKAQAILYAGSVGAEWLTAKKSVRDRSTMEVGPALRQNELVSTLPRRMPAGDHNIKACNQWEG